ncbi:hypothetical protein I4U23_006685 [Adineta vaga]|nr:hypothetical protein I4U23_006685 [Adineta vaga]
MASGHGHGSMSLSMKLIRFLIVLLNLTFILIGIILLAVGVFVVKDPKMQQLRPLLNPEITATYSQGLSSVEVFAIGIIAIGGVLLVIGFLGCCGAIKGFRFLHVLYALVIGLIILAEIAIVVIFFVYQNRFRTQLVTKLQDSIAAYYVGIPENNNTVVNSASLSWDFAQFNLQCCGAVNKSDFLRAANWSRRNPYQETAPLVVPFTCCPSNEKKSWTQLPTNFVSANTCATTGNTAYTQGCYDRLIDILSSYKNNVIIGGVIVLVIEILALVIAILLFRRKEDDVYDTL